MDKPPIIEQIGFVVAGASFLLSYMIYHNYSENFWYSLAGAALTAGVIWPTYIVLRWIYLAIKE